MPWQADLSKADECTGLVEATVAEMGRIDILVNNAGIQHVAPIEVLFIACDLVAFYFWRTAETHPTPTPHPCYIHLQDFGADNWDRIIAINLSSCFHTMAAAVPLMKAQARSLGLVAF